MFRSAIFIFVLSFLHWGCTQEVINYRPIIGIVTEETYNSSVAHNASSLIYASYVKFIESSGARVVPIWIRQPVDYYRNLLSKINGVLFPGVGVEIQGSEYSRTGKIILDIATQMNERGDYFPLWGTCLGFELIAYMVAKKNWMKACAAQDLSTNLTFTRNFKEGRMFRELDGKLEESMKKQDVVIHYHRWCITPQIFNWTDKFFQDFSFSRAASWERLLFSNFSTAKLDKYFKVLALNQDSRNLTFVSIIEAHNYPYYGVSFHPEKVLFEWTMTDGHQKTPHSLDAVRVSQYFGNFFVNEARRNGHQFSSKKEEDALLIYNYNPVFTGKINNNPIVQKYYFQ